MENSQIGDTRIPFSSRRRIKTRLTTAVMAGALLIGAASSANADRRPYVWTYAYMTKPPGGTELEYYLTSKTPRTDLVGESSWEHRLEFEFGLTEQWDLSIYQIFSQPSGSGLHYDAVQFRTRYRLGNSGQWVADPLLYLEYRRPSDLSDPNVLEGKLILARDFDRVNIAVNLIEEVEFAPGSEWETGYSAGGSVETSPVLRLGAEFFGDLFTEGNESHYFGPTLSLGRDSWFYTIGAGLGLNDHSDDVRVRAIFGVDL